MTYEQRKSLVAKIGESGLCDLESLYEEIPEMDLSDVTRELDARAIGWARRSAYMEKRALGGTHKEAVRAQNNKAKVLRRALGYTYPEQEITF